MRRTIILASFMVAILLPGCPGGTTTPAPTFGVTVKAEAPMVSSGGTTKLTATSRGIGGRLNTNTNVTFTSSDNAAGAILPRSGTTNSSAVLTATFTGGPVAVDTPVTVTAVDSASRGTTIVTVKPTAAFGIFGDPPGTAATISIHDITITPSVDKINSCDYNYAYTITSKSTPSSPNSSSAMENVSVTFGVAMTVSSAKATSGTPSSTAVAVRTLPPVGTKALSWVFFTPRSSTTTLATTNFNEITIKGTCEQCQTGGTAAWQVREFRSSSGVAPAEITNISSVGPQACGIADDFGDPSPPSGG